MVKFSDLEKHHLNPDEVLPKGRREGGKQSGLSFRELEKETRRITSGAVASLKEASEEERKAIYDSAADYLAGVLDSVRKRRRFALAPAVEIIGRIIESQSTDDPLLIRAIYEENPSGFLINHCVNVTIFAIKMATVLGLSKPEQAQIGLAALLHEVGMGVIPEKLINKEQKLDEQEYEIFKKRPEFAYKILKGFGEENAYLAETALQVHECMDGSGYPMGLSGDEIHVFAQIIGLVDMYEALIHSRPQREKLLHFSAVKLLIKTAKRRYPKKHIKALLNIFSVFPLHSFVKLNSNAIGRVVATFPEQPMRPRLEIVFDSQGRRVLVKHVVDLSENSILYITDSVSEKDMAGLAEGPGIKKYSQPKAAVRYGHGSATIQDIDDSSGDGSLGADILEITEDDFETSPPAAGREAAGTDRNTFSLQPDEAQDSRDEPVADRLVQIRDTERGRRIRRNRFILLGAGVVVLSGIVAWQAGLIDFQPTSRKDAVTRIQPFPKKLPAIPPPEVDKQKAVPILPKAETLPTAAVPIPSKADPTVPPKSQMESAAVSAPLPHGSTALNGPAAAAAAQPSYPYSIKLDSVQSSQDARSAISVYQAKGLNAYWVRANLGSQGIWYRIFAGYYQTPQQAEAVVSERGLQNAVVKETKYALLMGTFSSRAALEQIAGLLSDRGYSPYSIPNRDQTFYLFVGAFYTRKGAEAQYADLLSSGFQCQIVER